MKNLNLAALPIVMCLVTSYAEAASSPLNVVYSFDQYNDGTPNSNVVMNENENIFFGHTENLIYKFDKTKNEFVTLQKAKVDSADIGAYGYYGNFTMSKDKKFIYGVQNSFKHGVLFKMSVDGKSLENLHFFDLENHYYEGYDLRGDFLLSKDEHYLYGTTDSGGNGRARSLGGVVYRVTLDGSNHHDYGILHAFGSKTDGWSLLSNLVLSPDEKYLYGATFYGGTPSNNCGSIFQITLDGSNNPPFKIIKNLDCSNGMSRLNYLIGSKDGKYLYGTTSKPFSSYSGAVVRISLSEPDYPVKIVHRFVKETESVNPGSLVLSDDDTTLFGISTGGETKHKNYYPIIYKIDLKDEKNTYSKLYTFNDDSFSAPVWPRYINLSQSEKLLTGVSLFGGKKQGGTIFEVSMK